MKIRAICLTVVLSLCVFGASVLLAATTSDTQSLLAASSAAEQKSNPPVSRDASTSSQDSSIEVQDSSQNQPQTLNSSLNNSTAYGVATPDGRPDFWNKVSPMNMMPGGHGWSKPPWARGFHVIHTGDSATDSSDANLSDLARDQAKIISDQAETIRMLQHQLMGRASAGGGRDFHRQGRWSRDDRDDVQSSGEDADRSDSEAHAWRRYDKRKLHGHDSDSDGFSDRTREVDGNGFGHDGDQSHVHEDDMSSEGMMRSANGQSVQEQPADSEASDKAPQTNPVVVQVAGDQKTDSLVAPANQAQNSLSMARQVLAPIVAQARSFLPSSNDQSSSSTSSASQLTPGGYGG